MWWIHSHFGCLIYNTSRLSKLILWKYMLIYYSRGLYKNINIEIRVSTNENMRRAFRRKKDRGPREAIELRYEYYIRICRDHGRCIAGANPSLIRLVVVFANKARRGLSSARYLTKRERSSAKQTSRELALANGDDDRVRNNVFEHCAASRDASIPSSSRIFSILSEMSTVSLGRPVLVASRAKWFRILTILSVNRTVLHDRWSWMNFSRHWRYVVNAERRRPRNSRLSPSNMQASP